MENLFRDEQKKVKKRKKVAKSTLSFALDEEEGDGADTPSSRGENGDEEEKPAKRPKSRKNPEVDTSFLPDREREEEERRQREELRQEWLRKQEEMKKEEIEITYSYWDGSGHRRSVKVGALLVLSRDYMLTGGRTYSVRKATILLPSCRNAESSVPNSKASVWTI